MASDRIGLMIIRAWVEEGSAKPLRAYVRVTSDVSVGVERTFSLAETDDVCAAVGSWLREILAGVTPA